MNFFYSAMAGLVIAAALICLWLWLALHPVLKRSRGAHPRLLAWVPLQVSLVVLALGLMVYSPRYAFLLAGFPPILLLDALHLTHLAGFLAQVARVALPVGFAVLVLCLVWRPLRIVATGATLAAVGLTAFFAGERISAMEMCSKAVALGSDDLQRASLGWSIANRSGGPSHSNIHALMQTDAQRYGWSYHQMGWYKLPEDVVATVDGQVLACESPT
ncbi:hypothetical protein [uncultured Roseobacter sp.]|uniref:hypothetical protein n=1 Tax=uncultured Roseobacter sp. TaxID=114847 RepID=UPI0026095D9A|nr:hypothetical protein [uncultured Roseobacter sp.]